MSADLSISWYYDITLRCQLKLFFVCVNNVSSKTTRLRDMLVFFSQWLNHGTSRYCVYIYCVYTRAEGPSPLFRGYLCDWIANKVQAKVVYFYYKTIINVLSNADWFCLFQIYFRNYVAQTCLLNGTAYICFSIMDCHEMRRDVFLSTAQLSVL